MDHGLLLANDVTGRVYTTHRHIYIYTVNIERLTHQGIDEYPSDKGQPPFVDINCTITLRIKNDGRVEQAGR